MIEYDSDMVWLKLEQIKTLKFLHDRHIQGCSSCNLVNSDDYSILHESIFKAASAVWSQYSGCLIFDSIEQLPEDYSYLIKDYSDIENWNEFILFRSKELGEYFQLVKQLKGHSYLDSVQHINAQFDIECSIDNLSRYFEYYNNSSFRALSDSFINSDGYFTMIYVIVQDFLCEYNDILEYSYNLLETARKEIFYLKDLI